MLACGQSTDELGRLCLGIRGITWSEFMGLFEGKVVDPLKKNVSFVDVDIFQSKMFGALVHPYSPLLLPPKQIIYRGSPIQVQSKVPF